MVSDVKLKQYQNPPLGDRGQRKQIHPHKFIMWVAIGSIIMMFTGLTSAYVVKRSMDGWQSIKLPVEFWYSTAAIILSSLIMITAFRFFKEREVSRYRLLISLTILLGISFLVLQYLGFQQLWNSGITMQGSGAGQFLYVIAGLHILHVLGGLIALLVMFIITLFANTNIHSPVAVEVAGIYWHFVCLLWIYLILFFVFIG